MRHVTDIQRRLIELGYLPVLNERGQSNADGKFGQRSLEAFNLARAAKGLGPVVQTSMEELNRVLFPEEQPTPKPKKPDFFTGLLVNFALSKLKGLPAMNFLNGYKTYITAVLLILVGALSFVGITIPGFDMDPGAAITMALGLIFSRVGSVKA